MFQECDAEITYDMTRVQYMHDMQYVVMVCVIALLCVLCSMFSAIV